MKLTIANAPVSYGAFEQTVGIDPNVPDANQILDAVAEAGYAGIDLGPVGYLGVGQELVERLASRNLGLAGGYLELPFTNPAALEAMYPELDAMLDIFEAVRGKVPGPDPRPTLADAGNDRRRARPGQAHSDRSLSFNDGEWTAFQRGLRAVLARCRDRGFEPTFHQETSTNIEAPHEVAKILELTDASICLDTGHFMVGGGDPVQALKDWAERINHIHLKDANRSIMDGIIADQAPGTEIWSREVFCPLGGGDVEIEGVLAQLDAIKFEGWLVVEHDSFPKTAERFARARADQVANRKYLVDRGI